MYLTLGHKLGYQSGASQLRDTILGNKSEHKVKVLLCSAWQLEDPNDFQLLYRRK